jgi:RNA polymerase sigma factor (sigma-70 family)
VLSHYFSEIGGARVLTRAEEQRIARLFRARRAAVNELLAGLPFTGTTLIERWRTEQRSATRPLGLLGRAAHANRERAARTLEATIRRVERRLRRRPPITPRTPADEVAWDRFESRQRSDLLAIDLSPDFYQQVEAALRSRLREMARAARAHARRRARRLCDGVGFPIRRFRRRMRALESLGSARDEARNELARHNLKLVVRFAKKFQNLGLPLPDLIQEANLGLLRATELFDPDRGFKFSTYAIWWIRQSLVRAVQKQARTVRLPSHVNERLYQVGRASDRLAGRLGRSPTPRELGRETGLEPERVDQLRSLQRIPLSLDQTADSSNARALHEVLPDPHVESPLDLVDAARDRRVVAALLARLDARERAIIKRRFGFTGEECVTLDQLASELGVSRELVRQIEKRTLSKLCRWAGRARSNGGGRP